MNTITNRRHFLMQAGAIASGAWWGPQLFAAEKGAPGNSEEVPLAPPDRQPPQLRVPERPGRQLGWAIVGLGELALGEIMPAFGEAKLARPVALVSGHPEKAGKVASACGIAEDAIYNYETFDQLANDKRVDVVYIVLPNSMHAEFTTRALKAGKHVLCEKPMAASVDECQSMIEAAKEAKRVLGVAYRLHYEPFNTEAADLCKAKAIGQIRTITSSNCQNVKAPNIRLSRELAGGPLGDVGVYCINMARWVTGEEPTEVLAMAQESSKDPRFREVPESVTFQLRFPSGILMHADCSFGAMESRCYRIHGTEGLVDMDNAFGYRGQRLCVKRGDAKNAEAQWMEIQREPKNHFAAEMDGFSESILHGTPVKTPGEMGLADMRVMAAIEESWRTGKAVGV